MHEVLLKKTFMTAFLTKAASWVTREPAPLELLWAILMLHFTCTIEAQFMKTTWEPINFLNWASAVYDLHVLVTFTPHTMVLTHHLQSPKQATVRYRSILSLIWESDCSTKACTIQGYCIMSGIVVMAPPCYSGDSTKFGLIDPFMPVWSTNLTSLSVIICISANFCCQPHSLWHPSDWQSRLPLMKSPRKQKVLKFEVKVYHYVLPCCLVPLCLYCIHIYVF